MKDIIMTVQGGCVDVEKLPKGVNLILKDYDIESYRENDERLKEDETGSQYIERVFGS